jgi:hypothetical protein
MAEVDEKSVDIGPRTKTPAARGGRFFSTMPQAEPERSAAIGHVLSELTKLSLYEKRAAGRRDRTIRKLMKIKQTLVSRVELKSKTKSKV